MVCLSIVRFLDLFSINKFILDKKHPNCCVLSQFIIEFMTELKVKLSKLTFKGQKPTPIAKKPSVVESPLELNKKTSDNKEKSNSNSKLPTGQPVKKIKIDNDAIPISISSDKTASELSFDLVRKKRMAERIEKNLEKTYREKVDNRNKQLNKLPDHSEVHKIGEKIQKGY